MWIGSCSALAAAKLKEELMGARCQCGSEVRNTFDHLGCIQCGSACCPACSYTLESTHYCIACGQDLLELPWPVPAGGVLGKAV
jgi:hypothetical protein